MSEERRKNERRRWGRKVTYPFIDSDGVLVTKNRRRKIDRREVTPEEEAAANEQTPDALDPAPIAAKQAEKKNTSISMSDSKVMELEEALQSDDVVTSKIDGSIKDLENEILEATGIDQAASNQLNVTSKNETVDAEPDLPELALETADSGKSKGVSVELSVRGEKHLINLSKDSCKLGRDPNCDIVIQNKFVSRVHAKIAIKNGKLLIEDSSFNGTYIEFENGQKLHLSKDEHTLVASGVMSMGKPVDDKSKSVISFKINT